ncbi:hypothetical protein [Streptomyces antibioticus]|uniref:hypothetical protein n=1 Tax=Streptomyces antibioticus TaxID=1890 RepID=UPI003F470636
MSVSVADALAVSPECAVALRPGYEDLHRRCRQFKDIPLPHSTGILLVQRCRCACHGLQARGS